MRGRLQRNPRRASADCTTQLQVDACMGESASSSIDVQAVGQQMNTVVFPAQPGLLPQGRAEVGTTTQTGPLVWPLGSDRLVRHSVRIWAHETLLVRNMEQ